MNFLKFSLSEFEFHTLKDRVMLLNMAYQTESLTCLVLFAGITMMFLMTKFKLKLFYDEKGQSSSHFLQPFYMTILISKKY